MNPSPPSPALHRRDFLRGMTVSTLITAASARAASSLHISTNTYPWGTFARRENKPFKLHSDEALAAIAACGINGYEPSVSKPEEFDGLGDHLRKHGLEMRSIYVGSTLHDEAQVAKNIEQILAIGRRAAELGTRIIVTNPSPIKWGGSQTKSDEQLATQAKALDTLGTKLRTLGITLAYHNHDIELRDNGREYHYMLCKTNPDAVKFCLDVHWVYRGSGNSQPAVFDTLERYGSRIVELHIRQSHDKVWREDFVAQDDLDYVQLASWLGRHTIKPHLVLEQCVEAKSPNTMTGDKAHTLSTTAVRQVFASL